MCLSLAEPNSYPELVFSFPAFAVQEGIQKGGGTDVKPIYYTCHKLLL